MLRLAGVVVTVALALVTASCGDDVHSPPVVYTGHGVQITVDPGAGSVQVVRLSDNQVIYDGLPGGPAGTDAPPEVGAATRDATFTVDQQIGAYQFHEDKAPWTGAVQFDGVTVTGDVITLGLLDADRVSLGHLTITTGDVMGATDGAGAEVRMQWSFDRAGGTTRASIAYACQPDEHFLGLGGMSWDVDQRGQTVPIWVQEDGVTKRPDDQYVGAWFLTGRRHTTHLPMPMFISTRGYAVAVDTDAQSLFAICSEDEHVVRIENWQPTLDLHLFVGEPDAADPAGADAHAIDLMTAWVGRPDVPNDVLFAPWLDALYGDANLRRVAQKLRDSDIAASVIWTEDWRGAEQGLGGYQLLENWNVDRSLYPDLEGTAGVLHGLGYRFLTYNNTFLEERADVYHDALDHDYEIHQADGTPYIYVGNTAHNESMLDLWNPAAVSWAKDIYRTGESEGADGWMADFGEWLPTDAALADGSDPMLRHNRYTVEWAKLNHDLAAERAASDPIGLIYFMRSSYEHSQPLVQMVWPGDQQTDWTLGDGFPSVIPPGIGLGVTGFPYYAHDIGGYMSELTGTPTLYTSKELWFRWCELGALTPVMRTHHGRASMQNWNWESDAETTALMSRYSHLHMELVPYLAARAAEAFATGLPIMRPVGLIDPGDAWAWSTTDEYLLGDRILVAPVITEGATTRDVKLPAGLWYPLLTGAPVQGGTTVTVDAPVSEIPAFVPEGSILVEYPDTVQTVVPAPADSGIVTAADVGDDRVVTLFEGTAARAATATHALRGASYTWSGRDPSLPAPVSATFGGADVAVTSTADGVTITVTGPGTLTLDGGGTLTMTGAIGTTTVFLRM